VEGQLETIYQFEEIQWQRRGGVNWILKGDSNSRYFHGIANNKKKKCTMFSLEDGEHEIWDQKAIRGHVEEYYRTHFGREADGSISLGENFWAERGRLTAEEDQELIKPFTLKELEMH
jgi:mannosylglycoprotein endo-beta-mannosidase